MTTIHLPRFTMNPGDTWRLRVSRIKPNGFTLGNGFVKTGEFEILRRVMNESKVFKALVQGEKVFWQDNEHIVILAYGGPKVIREDHFLYSGGSVVGVFMRTQDYKHCFLEE